MAETQASDGPEVVTVAGVRIPLDPQVMSPKIQDQLRAGRYEMLEARHLPAMIEPGERVLDLGAGIGFLSTLVALQGRAATVVAVEGNPDAVDYIRRLLAFNGVTAEVRHAAIAPEKTSDTLPFHVHHDLWASSLIPLKAKARRGVVEVPAFTLAELIAEHRPSLLVIDLEVLRCFAPDPRRPDAPDLLHRMTLGDVPKVLIEVQPKDFGLKEIKRVFDCFARQGYAYDPRQSCGCAVLFRKVGD